MGLFFGWNRAWREIIKQPLGEEESHINFSNRALTKKIDRASRDLLDLLH